MPPPRRLCPNCSSTWTDQRWIAVEVAQGWAQLKNVWSGKCLAVGSSWDDGARLIQWPCINDFAHRDQVWATSGPSAPRMITNWYSGKCIGVGSELGNGAQAIQWNCTNNGADLYWFAQPMQ
jgi:hypothetical protein